MLDCFRVVGACSVVLIFFFFFDNFKVIHIKDLNKKQKKKAHLFLIVVKALAY